MERGGEAVNEHDRHAAPVLITEAAPSYEDEQAARRRKYILMMGMRFPCLVLAGVFHQIWWLALALLVLSIPLPWVAVLIANDRPPRKSESVSRYRRRAPSLEDGQHRVIDSSDPEPGSGSGRN
ncbi:DUF3099 domain-containing protein [Saccharomonospora piscinae]|uniref:DUF3099 domain-containing protein n=1 Tax=Saccharomonospora piscinae TaxID=687388 RepID=UPI0004638684|nr:DUF3099 domain-containing protein [Saccharomonospora piscinae]